MAKLKRNKNGICVFCGIEGMVTKDHIPPKNLFVGFPDNSLIKVPSCEACNNQSKLDDEYFRAFLIPQNDIISHPQVQQLNRIVREKFDSSNRKGLEMRMYSQLHSKNLYTPAGIYLGEKKLIYGEYSRIDTILKKILKGLFFHVTEEIFPSGFFNLAVVDKRQINDIERILNIELSSLVEELKNFPFYDIYDIFSYKWGLKDDSEELLTVWLLTFFGKREFFGITYPKNLGSEINLIDSDPNEIAQIII